MRELWKSVDCRCNSAKYNFRYQDENVDTFILKKEQIFIPTIGREDLCMVSDLVYIACTYVFDFHERHFDDSVFPKFFLVFLPLLSRQSWCLLRSKRRRTSVLWDKMRNASFIYWRLPWISTRRYEIGRTK